VRVSSKRPASREKPPAPEPLTPLIDAHTHLDACGATDTASIKAIVDRAAAVGVQAVVTIADDLESARWVTQAADADPRVYAAVALHPTRADALTDEAKAVIERLAEHPRVVAIGETGLDMYWPGKLDGCAEPAVQREAFAWHIDLAKRTGKPLMIHNRDADSEVLDVLRAEGAPQTVIFHCFSSGTDMARSCVAGGWLLSLSGTVSFRNAHALREAATLIPVDQLLVETDAPFLTPHPYRGAPNEPYCLPYTVRALAEVVDRPAVDIAQATTSTAVRAYGLASCRPETYSLPFGDRTGGTPSRQSSDSRG
jgi:TatD DNase family protein